MLLVDALDEADPADKSAVLRAVRNPLLRLLSEVVAGRMVEGGGLPLGAVRVVATTRWVQVATEGWDRAWQFADDTRERLKPSLSQMPTGRSHTSGACFLGHSTQLSARPRSCSSKATLSGCSGSG